MEILFNSDRAKFISKIDLEFISKVCFFSLFLARKRTSARAMLFYHFYCTLKISPIKVATQVYRPCLKAC